jgi:hypothetical protein
VACACESAWAKPVCEKPVTPQQRTPAINSTLRSCALDILDTFLLLNALPPEACNSGHVLIRKSSYYTEKASHCTR